MLTYHDDPQLKADRRARAIGSLRTGRALPASPGCAADCPRNRPARWPGRIVRCTCEAVADRLAATMQHQLEVES